jgi:hypothetical protein
MKILGYDGFKYKNDERQQEVINTIKWNTKYFDTMYIFSTSKEDYEYYLSLSNDKIKVEHIQGSSELSMQDIFNLVNQRSSPEDIKSFTNLDTIFSDSWNSVSIPDDVFMLLTNRSTEDGSPNGGVDKPSWTEGLNLFNQKNILDPTKFVNYNDPNLPSTLYGRWFSAQCGWSWKTIKPIKGRAFLGHRGAESAFLREVRRAGYKPFSGALRYPTYHNHCSNTRTDRQFNIVDSAVNDGRLHPWEVLKSTEV